MQFRRRFAALGPLVFALGCRHDAASDAEPVAQADAGGAAEDGSARVDDAGGGADRDGGISGSDDGTMPDGAGCATCARNWSLYPPVAQVTGASELWVVSDVHGDYAAFTTLLTGAKLIAGAPDRPGDVTWTGGTATLVIVGDLIDKGPDAIDVVRLASSLQTAARAGGGGVVVTMGNHEAEFLADPSNSKASGTDRFDPELVDAGLTAAATAAGQDDVGAFVRNLPFAARVDDWFFVHAGKTDGRTIAALASDLQTGVDALGFGAPVLSAADSLLEARLNAQAPQWWDATNDAQALLTEWTSALGVKHLVMGHQPDAFEFADNTKRAADQMIQYYGALLFLVDIGLSVGVDDTGGAFLHVVNPGTASESFEEVLPLGVEEEALRLAARQARTPWTSGLDPFDHMAPRAYLVMHVASLKYPFFGVDTSRRLRMLIDLVFVAQGLPYFEAQRAPVPPVSSRSAVLARRGRKSVSLSGRLRHRWNLPAPHNPDSRSGGPTLLV